MEQESFGFPPSFAPRRYQQRTSRAGPGHRARTWCYTAGIGRTSDLRARSLRATSCRTFFLVSTLIDRLAVVDEPLGHVVQVAELGVTVGMLAALR